jgi:hypothetical protein
MDLALFYSNFGLCRHGASLAVAFAFQGKSRADYGHPLPIFRSASPSCVLGCLLFQVGFFMILVTVICIFTILDLLLFFDKDSGGKVGHQVHGS